MYSNNKTINSDNLNQVKKLAYIVTLDNMLKTYDDMEQQGEDTILKCGRSVSDLTDAISMKLTHLVNSKRTLTCRNVLIANYDTMTNLQYWLNHKLFADLPKADAVALKKKIRQMVDLMAELAMKIFRLGESHSEAFFKKLMKSYDACQNTPYMIWKTRQLRLTIKEYRQYQAELTADILNLGIMDHDDTPRDDERAAVRLDLLTREMSHGKQLSDNFIDAAAKLRRYTYWEGDKFMVDYPLIKQYLYRIFDKLTNDQRIALYYYNVQMKQLHQDMDELAGRQASKAHDKADVTAQQDETLCLLIDPSVDDEELKIHNVIKRLVRRQGIQEICTYLYQLKNEKKVMLPQNAEKTYHELVRMGMPGGEGYSLKTFMKYYRR